MKLMMPMNNKQLGFTATVSVILMSLGILVFSLSVSMGAILYSDYVNNREFRMQAQYNLSSCKDIFLPRFKEDNVLLKHAYFSELGCVVNIDEKYPKILNIDSYFMNIHLSTTTSF